MTHDGTSMRCTSVFSTSTMRESAQNNSVMLTCGRRYGTVLSYLGHGKVLILGK